MSFEDWQKGTALTLQTRSELLRALDLEIQLYERNPTVFRLSRVQEGLQAWKKSKGVDGAWKRDQRNGNGTVSLLDQQLRGQGDTDVATGAQAFMAPALVNARLGVLYLFANTSSDDSIFKVVLDGGLDMTKGVLDEFKDVKGVETAARVVGVAQKPAGMAAAKVEAKVRAPSRQEVSSNTLLSGDTPIPNDSKLRRAYEWMKAKLSVSRSQAWAPPAQS
jgi:hypothetical protein